MTYCAFWRIHARKWWVRSNASGHPRAQGMFHETVPISDPPETKGPPESPWQIPCPDRVNVQILWSKTKAAFVAVWRARQSALVKVVVVKAWSWFGAAPPVTAVPPHPVTMALAPPPVNADAKGMALTLLLKPMTVAVWTTETSLAIVCALYDGWLTILELVWTTPPEFNKTVPTTTRTEFWARLTCQWNSFTLSFCRYFICFNLRCSELQKQPICCWW